MNRQMTLAEMNDELGAARTNKKEFLEKLERIIPWTEFIKLIKPYYYKGERGNKPYPLELMLRIFILQNVYTLSDMAVMNEIIDSRAFSNYCTVKKNVHMVTAATSERRNAQMPSRKTNLERTSNISLIVVRHPSKNYPKAVNMLLRKENVKNHLSAVKLNTSSQW